MTGYAGRRRARGLLGRAARSLTLANVVIAGVPGSAMLLFFRGLSEPAPGLRFAAALFLFMVPGVLLSRRVLGRTSSGLALLPTGFAISAGVFGLPGAVFLILQLSMEAYLWTSGAIVAACGAAVAYRALRANRLPRPPAEDSLASKPSNLLLWFPFALLLSVLAAVSARRVPNANDDIWVYLAWVREFTGADRLAASEPYFGHETNPLSRIRVNGWLLEQAALSRAAGLEPIELVLRYLTPTLAVLAPLAVYALARELLRSERSGLVSGLLFALFHLAFIEPSMHNVGVELIFRVAEDKHAARFIMVPVALMCAARFIRTRRISCLGMFALLCLATVTVHPAGVAMLGLCMLGFGLARVLSHPLRRGVWIEMSALALALLGVVAAFAAVRLADASSGGGLYSADINSTPPGVLEGTVFVADHWRHIFELDGGQYIMHPWLLLNPVILASYALGVPFLIRRLRRGPAAQFLLGGLFLTTAVVYVPPVATYVGDEIVGPNLLWRLAWPIPLLVLITAGWMVSEGLSAFQKGLGGLGVRPGYAALSPVAAMAVILAAALPGALGTAIEVYREYPAARTAVYDPDPIYPWLRHSLDRPVTLLAPDAASTAIPAYSEHANVVSYRSRAFVEREELLERESGREIRLPRRYVDAYGFFSNQPEATLGSEDTNVLRRYGVDYVMVGDHTGLDARLRASPTVEPVADAPEGDFRLYRVDDLPLRPS